MWEDWHEAKSAEEQDIQSKNKIQVQKLLNDVVTRVPESPRKREKVPTFQEALTASIAARKSKALLEPPTPAEGMLEVAGLILPLMDDEIPQNAQDLVRLVLLRPEATLKYLLEAKMVKARSWS